jgi:hypothetical protein
MQHTIHPNIIPPTGIKLAWILDSQLWLGSSKSPVTLDLSSDILTEFVSRAHIKKRHYDEEQIPTDVRYQLEQQRRKQRDEEKWESLYKILFPGEMPPSPCMDMIFIQAFNTTFHMCLLLMISVLS